MSSIDNPNPHFFYNQGKGFAIKFENGCRVSVVFGWGCYCDNYDNDELSGITKNYQYERVAIPSFECANAEVMICTGTTGVGMQAVLDACGIEYDGGDSVIGRLTPDQVGKIIAYVQAIGGHNESNRSHRNA